MPSTAPSASGRPRSAAPRGSGAGDRRARWRSRRRRSAAPTPAGRPPSARARGAPRRSSVRSWNRASAVASGRDGREEALDELAVRLAVEVALEDLGRAGDREVDGLATQVRNRPLALVVDLDARALEE